MVVKSPVPAHEIKHIVLKVLAHPQKRPGRIDVAVKVLPNEIKINIFNLLFWIWQRPKLLIFQSFYSIFFICFIYVCF